jgi:aminopeptidase N
MLSDFVQLIKYKHLEPIDRLGIVRDAFALAESGQLPTIQALQLVRAYEDENDYTVWVELSLGLNQMDNLFHTEVFYPEYKRYCQKIYKKIAYKLGWQTGSKEPHTSKLLRNLALYNFGSFGDKNTIEHALKIFKAGKTSPDIRSTVYLLAAENGNDKLHQKFITMYKQSDLQEEKNRIGRALGRFKKRELLQKTLEFAISKNVRLQDAPSIIVAVWSNFFGKDLAWSFFKRHWPQFVKCYGEGSNLLQRMVKSASLFTTKKYARDVKGFLEKHKFPAVKRTTEQVLEKINSNAAWLKAEKTAVGRWITQQNRDEN